MLPARLQMLPVTDTEVKVFADCLPVRFHMWLVGNWLQLHAAVWVDVNDHLTEWSPCGTLMLAHCPWLCCMPL